MGCIFISPRELQLLPTFSYPRFLLLSPKYGIHTADGNNFAFQWRFHPGKSAHAAWSEFVPGCGWFECLNMKVQVFTTFGLMSSNQGSRTWKLLRFINSTLAKPRNKFLYFFLNKIEKKFLKIEKASFKIYRKFLRKTNL